MKVIGNCIRTEIGWSLLLVALVLPCPVFGDQQDLLADLTDLEFPEPAELSREYPGPDDNEIAKFRVRLHKDISGLLGSAPPSDDREILDAYLKLLNQWLESDSLTKCVLAGAITMAIDEYLNHAVNEYRHFSEERKESYYAMVRRNDLTGKAWFGAVDRALRKAGSPHKPLSEFCADNKIMPSEACWKDYVRQFGLICERVRMDPAEVVFLDGPVGRMENPLARFGFLEEFARNPVFMLHVKETSFVVQFAARVLDENRIRRIVWEQELDREPDLSKEGRVQELTARLNSFAPAGERWLASEIFVEDSATNLIYFRRKLEPRVLRDSYASPVSNDDTERYKSFMETVLRK